jgi:hypothetical protein
LKQITARTIPAGPIRARLAIRALAFGAAFLTALAGCSLIVGAGLTTRGTAAFDGPPGFGAWTGRQRAWFTMAGFYGPEAVPDQNRHFAWTTRSATISVPRVDRTRPHVMRLRMSAPRPAGLPAPEVAIGVDGITVERLTIGRDARDVAIVIAPAERDRVDVTLTSSNDFVPGTSDTRALALKVDSIAIGATEGRLHLPTKTAWLALATLALYGAIAGAFGTTVPLSIGLGAFAGLTHGWLLIIDGGFLGTLPDRALTIAMGGAAAAVIVGVLSFVRRGSYPGWPAAAALVMTTTCVKLAFFAHPAVNIGDAVFQVHRAQLVHAGRYYFTSVTPRPFFEFPYAIALYVTSMPLWSAFPSELDKVHLLRGVAIVADSSVALALYFLAARFWSSHRAGLAAAALYPSIGITTLALCTANLTNVFGQGIFGLAVAYLLWEAGGRRRWWHLVPASAVLAYAFLSHFSTVSIGVPLVAAIGLSLLASADVSRRQASIWVLAALLLAGGVSYVTYYSHFTEVYKRTLARVAARDGEAPRRSMVRPVSSKTTDYVSEVRAMFGVPLLIAAVAGIALIIRDRRRDFFSVALAAWLAVTLVFVALGIVSAIEMRANLAAAPLAAALAAYAIAHLADGYGRRGAALASVATIIIVGWGVLFWGRCLGV